MKSRSNQIESMVFCRNEQNEDGKWVEDPDQTTKLKANFVISAFGSELNEKDGKILLLIKFQLSIFMELFPFSVQFWTLYHRSN